MADGVCLAGRTQIGQQSERIGIKQTDILQVRHGQSKARALQQMGAIAQFGKRGDPRVMRRR